MKRILISFGFGMAALAGAASAGAVDTGSETQDEALMESVILGEEDMAERMEIERNRYRRMTPGEGTLVQDVGTWPAAWEEFSPRWNSAAAVHGWATWKVPFVAARESGTTVLQDAGKNEMWRGMTDFSKAESGNVTLTGALVAEDDWPSWSAAQEEIDGRLAPLRSMTNGGTSRGGGWTNGLRFTNIWATTNGDFRLDFAWDEDGDVQVFCRAMQTTSWVETVVCANDENEVVTNELPHWRQADVFHGIPDAWELLGVVAISNGTGTFIDASHPPGLAQVRFYAAAALADSNTNGITDGEEWVWEIFSTTADTDNDGLSDYAERKHHKTDPLDPDTDNDGLSDGDEIAMWCTDPRNPDSDQDGLPDGWEVQNGLEPLDAAGEDGADGDRDGDGFTNAQEYSFGAPANNPAWNGEELAWKLTHHTANITNTAGILTTNWTGLRVEVEDSADCGGTNAGIQDVTANLAVPGLLALGYDIEIVVEGTVEDVDTGYDKVRFEAEVATELFSSHDGIPDGEFEECRMVAESANAIVRILPHSTVKLRYDTVGHKWHSGAYAEVVSALAMARVPGDFELVRERNASCNRVPNPKQTTPTRLFVTTEASGQVELDVIPVIPPELRSEPVLCAIYRDNTHLASAAPNSDGVAALSFTPSSNVQTSLIRFGIDENANGILDLFECFPTTNTIDVLSFNQAHYDDRRSSLEFKALIAEWGPYNVGATLLYRFCGAISNQSSPFNATSSASINCLVTSNLTHNAGAAFDTSGTASLDVCSWNRESEASHKISESDAIKSVINLMLSNHAAEVTTYFATYMDADEYSATWMTNNVHVNFRHGNPVFKPNTYDLHVSFGNVILSYMTVAVTVGKTFFGNLAITRLVVSGSFEDLYDFNYERGNLNSDGAVLQIGWDASNTNRTAGGIFFDHVDFGQTFNSWSFTF